MSYPKSVIVVITCHGVIQIEKSNNQPKLFKIPNDMKIVKLSAVTPGVCNMTIDDDVNEFIDLILDKKKKKEMKEGLENPEKYAKTLGELYKKIEKETVENLYTESPDSNTILRKTFIQHRDKSYKIVTYNQKHPNMINKEYVRNNKNEQNSSKWDYGIYCLNVNGKPDLITKIKGRTYRDKDTSIFLNEIIDFLHQQGVKEVTLIDLSCSNFEYEYDENNSESSISERNTRSIRSNILRDGLNGGSVDGRIHLKKGTIKARELFGGRKTKRNKKNKSTIQRKRDYFKLLKNIKGAGKKEDIQKILEVYENEQTKKLVVFKILKNLSEEKIKDIKIEIDKNPNYLNEWIKIDKDGSIVYGRITNGGLNGKGFIVYSNDDIHEGNFENNILTSGKITLKNGQIIEGEFKNGDLIRGKMMYPNGTFEGEFEDNRLTVGRIILKNGDVLNGPNQIVYANGDIYQGNYETDFKLDNNNETQIIYVRNGVGKMTYADGSIYEGSFKDNKRDGLGKFTDPADGTVYEGQWKNGQRYGQGTQSNARGESYQGNFRKGKRHGEGIMIWEGNEKTGTFYKDKFVNDEGANI